MLSNNVSWMKLALKIHEVNFWAMPIIPITNSTTDFEKYNYPVDKLR